MIFSWWQYCIHLSAAPFEHVGGCTRTETARRTDIIFVAGKITAPGAASPPQTVAPQSTVTIYAPGRSTDGGTLNN